MKEVSIPLSKPKIIWPSLGEVRKESMEIIKLKAGILFSVLLMVLTPYKINGSELNLLANTDWKNLDIDQYLDYKHWEKESDFRDKLNPLERRILNIKRPEAVGRALKCVGNCYLFRGKGLSPLKFRGRIDEGDEVTTFDQGQAWIYLFDGTLVRIFPHSSVSFKEINIGTKKHFLQIRVNFGHVYIKSRSRQRYKLSKKRETDPLFAPIDVFAARKAWSMATLPVTLSANPLKSKEKRNQASYAILNQLIRMNNQDAEIRPTEYMVVLPNGTIRGNRLNLHVVSLTGKAGLIKNQEDIGLAGRGEEAGSLLFYPRGFYQRATQKVALNRWMRISAEGREITLLEDVPRGPKFGEFITSQIPNILIGREVFFRRYSLKFFRPNLAAKKLLRSGYILWNDAKIYSPKLDRRISFLLEYQRRVETAHLFHTKRFQSKFTDQLGNRLVSDYSEKFYQNAIEFYFRMGQRP